MLLIVLGVLVELYRPMRTYLTVKNEDPVVNVEFGSLAVWKCGILRTERPFSATVRSSAAILAVLPGCYLVHAHANRETHSAYHMHAE